MPSRMALSAQAVALRCALRRLFAAAPTILAMKSCPPFSAGEGAVPRRPTWSLVKWSTSPHEDRRAAPCCGCCIKRADGRIVEAAPLLSSPVSWSVSERQATCGGCASIPSSTTRATDGHGADRGPDQTTAKGPKVRYLADRDGRPGTGFDIDRGSWTRPRAVSALLLSRMARVTTIAGGFLGWRSECKTPVAPEV